jgi:hypothetical protein
MATAFDFSKSARYSNPDDKPSGLETQLFDWDSWEDVGGGMDSTCFTRSHFSDDYLFHDCKLLDACPPLDKNHYFNVEMSFGTSMIHIRDVRR